MGSSPPAIQPPWPDLNRQYPDSMPGVFLLHYRGFQRTGQGFEPCLVSCPYPMSLRCTSKTLQWTQSSPSLRRSRTVATISPQAMRYCWVNTMP